MAAPTLTVVLSGSGPSVTLRSAAGPLEAPVKRPSMTSRTQGGSLVQFTVGQTYSEMTALFAGFNDAMWQTLKTFFNANWGSDFTYTDPNGAAHTARFLDDTLPGRKVYKDHWEVSLHLNLTPGVS